MDAVMLARVQFAFTVGFHYLFPPISIGLGLILVIMEGAWLKTGKEIFHTMTRFWTKVFGLVFAVGVATGIVLEFEFGTNWATYSRYVGDIFGSALAAEGIFAFFLESGFLAIVLFGWDKVRPGIHFFATCMVCLGAHFSAIWIIVANSWQQTPAGYHIVTHGGSSRAEITDFWAMVFNPSSMDRLMHTVFAAWLTGAFFVLSVSAYYLLRNRHKDFAVASMKIALVIAAVVSLVQVVSGHRSAAIVAEHQPAKLAAFEGLYESGPEAGLALFGWVDEENQRVIGPVVPGMLSYLVHGDTQAPIKGLNDFAVEDRPPVQATFQFYHLMLAAAGAMIGISILGMFLWWRRKLFAADGRITQAYLWVLVFAVFLPHLGNQAGWFAAEVGRQPWIVYNLLRTSDGVSKVVGPSQIMFSLALFTVIYLLLGVLFIFLLDHKIKAGPSDTTMDTTAKRFVPGTGEGQ